MWHFERNETKKETKHWIIIIWINLFILLLYTIFIKKVQTLSGSSFLPVIPVKWNFNVSMLGSFSSILSVFPVIKPSFNIVCLSSLLLSPPLIVISVSHIVCRIFFQLYLFPWPDRIFGRQICFICLITFALVLVPLLHHPFCW